MANTNSPFGFQEYYGGAGGAPTFSQSSRRIASGNGTAIYRGDPVMPVVSTANGYITQGAPGSTTLAGIFIGCKYQQAANNNQTKWSNYWPGSGATGDVEAYVVDDPNARFRVMGNSTTFNITGTISAMTSSPIGQYAQFAIGSGSASTQQSGAYLNSLATTVTFPFIVLGLVGLETPGVMGVGNGADPTTAYNHVIVGFNNEIMRSNGAGPLGIS